MSSHFRSEQACIEYMARLSGKDWHLLTTGISWMRRRGTLEPDDIPAKLGVIADQIMDPDEWRRIRSEVARVRRAIYRERVKGQHQQREERRREYMRGYMARYRSGKL